MTNCAHPIIPTEILLSIQKTFQRNLASPRFKSLLRDRHSGPSSKENINIPQLNLPLPDDIDHAFDGFAVSSQRRAQMTDRYRARLEELRQIHRQKFADACRELHQFSTADDSLASKIRVLQKSCESIYLNRLLPAMQNEIITALRTKYTPLASEPKKVPFNAECTPLLEKYFEMNAYPSAPDRQILAQKTTMSPRQIEVWFQNHRKRARASGKIVRRPSPSMLYQFSPSQMNATSSSSVDELGSSITSDEEDRQHPKINNSCTNSVFLDAVSPSKFTFPCPFSPSSFNNTFTFAPVEWPRKPSLCLVSRPEVDMDDFSIIFASKLHIRDATMKRKSPKTPRQYAPWFFATTTISPRAPHPAFVPMPRTRPNAPVFDSPPPALPPSKATRTSTSPMPRKAAPFPKRHPSKFHPYSKRSTHARMGSVVTNLPFGNAAANIASWPSRSNGTPLSDATWLSILESTPNSATDNSSWASPHQNAEAFSGRSSFVENRVPSLASDSTFGSRSSSLSSLDYSSPSSPMVQPQNNDIFNFDHQTLLTNEMAEFDRLLSDDTHQQLLNDLFPTHKQDGSVSFPYFHAAHSAFPNINYIQATS